jgi:hypothetical protein
MKADMDILHATRFSVTPHPETSGFETDLITNNLSHCPASEIGRFEVNSAVASGNAA